MRHPFAARWAVPERDHSGRPPRRSRVLATCIAIAVFSAATSFVCLWQAKADLDLRTLSNESRAWPSAPGEIIEAQLARSSGRGPSVGASVRYRFIVGEKTFEGQTMAFDEPRGAAAENAVRQYRPGTKVRVFYRPRAPSTSVLERPSSSGSSGSTGWQRTGALAFTALGAGLLAVALARVARRIARDPRPT
jgi:Protein of unknown function (DUF3592)